MKFVNNGHRGMLLLMSVLIGTNSSAVLEAACRSCDVASVNAVKTMTMKRSIKPMASVEVEMVDVAQDLADGLNLEQTLKTVLETAKTRGNYCEVPSGVAVCHDLLAQGKTTLPAVEFRSAANYITRNLCNDTCDSCCTKNDDCRAGGRGQGVLLDGRKFTSPSLGLDNENFQVIKFLNCIRRTLGKISKELNECCQEVKQDFRQTWELLEELDMDVQDCCCELKADLRECCEEIKEDFRKTWHKLDKLGNEDCVVSKHLPDFVFPCNDNSEWDINSLDLSKDCAFDEINQHKASIFEWLKMIYILARNINNKLVDQVEPCGSQPPVIL